MSARNTLKWIVLPFVVVTSFCFNIFASPIYTYSGGLDLNIFTDPNSVDSTVTYGGEVDLDIPADSDDSKGWMVDAVIEVPDNFTIEDLDVGISLTHDSVFDLQITLESPSGTTVTLNMYNPSEEYIEGEDYIDTIFDDEAEIPIGQAEPPFPGRYQPQDPLSAFDGEDAQGTWRLQIYDAYYTDTGSLESFELMITIPEPATTMLLLLGAGLSLLLRPHRKGHFHI